MEIRISHVFLLAITLGIAAIWYFGRDRPVEIRVKSNTEEHVTSCSKCSGIGIVDCPRCGRFGSVKAQALCPTCKGSGKHQWRFGDKPDAPCQKCRGTGRVETRTKCTHCDGKGKVPCPSCKGTGKSNARTTTSYQSVSMGYSIWERFLLVLRLSVDPNPCPQRDSKRTYPMVAEYVRMKSAQRPCRITDWGEFKQRGPEWVMPATVEFTKGDGTSVARVIEFVVQNRELKTTRTIE